MIIFFSVLIVFDICKCCLVPPSDLQGGKNKNVPRLKEMSGNIGIRPNSTQSRPSASKSVVFKTKHGEVASLCRQLDSEFNASANSLLNVANLYNDAELIGNLIVFAICQRIHS